MGLLQSRRGPRRRRTWVRRPFSADVQLLGDRTLLAGDVQVLLSGRDVVLIGDAADNAVNIFRRNDWVVVAGMNGTTLNGMNEFLISGRPTLRDDLIVKLGDGNDALIVGPGVGIADDFIVEMGAGNDVVNVDGATIGDDLIIYTGDGDDTVVVTNTTIGDDQGVFAGIGNNTVTIADTTTADDLVLHTHNGNDTVTLLGSPVGDRSWIETFGGNNTTDVVPINDGRPLPGDDAVGIFIDPIAVDDAFEIDNGSLNVTAAGGLLPNDFTAPIGGATTASLENGPEHGTVTVNPDGSFSYTADSTFTDHDTFEYRLTNTFGGSDTATVEIRTTDVPLTLDLSGNRIKQSNGTLVTDTASFQILGTTTPLATVTLNRDGDGKFDDGMETADGMGNFSFDVTLSHTDTNLGANVLQVRATVAGTNRQKTERIDIHFAEGTVVRFDSSQDTLDVELFDEDAPNTVANFVSYFPRYVNSVIHRAISGFVIQGGGFTFDAAGDPQVDSVQTFPPITNEFKMENLNERGTLSMAQLGGAMAIDSGTSQWFFNLVKNAHLDLEGVRHTVFGRVIGTGMTVVDAIAALPTFNLNGVFPETALTTVPLANYTPFTRMLNGTVSVVAGFNIVDGVGTNFASQLRPAVDSAPGSSIRIGTEEFTVVTVLSDTQLTLNRAHPTGVQNDAAFANASPAKEHYALFSNIDRLFDV